MMLYGLFYKCFPKAAGDRLPMVHFWVANVGLVAITGMAVFRATREA